MPAIPTLVTERLVLRPPSPTDLSDVIALNSDPEVMRYIGQGQTMSSTQSAIWLEFLIAGARHGFPAPGTPNNLPGWLTMIDRESQAFVGLAALAMLPDHHINAIGHDRCVGPTVEVGYRLAKPFWGQGYASEAAQELVRYAFQTMDLFQLVGIADVRNGPSNRVLDKIGLPQHVTYELDGISIHFHCVTQGEWRSTHHSI